MQHIYGLFGFEFKLELSTRPDNFLGTIETWDEAESVSNAVIGWLGNSHHIALVMRH